MNIRTIAVTAIAVLGLAFGTAPALAGKGRGNQTPAAASCAFAGNVVTASGLPTDQLVNFMVTDDSGTWGFVLGYTPDGTWSVNVPAPAGPTTYEFVSRTFGNDGSKYRVFATCTA